MARKISIDQQEATRIASRALTDRGVPMDDATAMAEILVEASLLGVTTHGLRLLPTYLDELDRGVAKAQPQISVVNDRGATVLLDAGDALGTVAGLRGVTLAVERARQHGAAVIGVRRSNHFGPAGAYTRRIAAQGMLGIATTSAASRVAPFGGADPLLGTNPVSIAFGDEFCLDMATSQICYSEITTRARIGQPLASGWAVEKNGRPIADARQAHALSPLGGYKGQGLAMAVTLLTSVLMGGPLDWELEHLNTSADGCGRGVCHHFIAIDPQAFGGADVAKKRCADLLSAVRQSRPENPRRPVLAPGDPQRAHWRRQEVEGLEFDSVTSKSLDVLA